MTVGEALVADLARRGVSVVFGIPGVHTIELYRGLAGSGIRHVTPRHEQGAGFMADGYARVSGRPGVAFVITGPGVTNILTPMGQARADSIPMLVVSSAGAVPTLGKGLGYLHDLPDQQALAAQVALLSVHVRDAAELGPALDKVFDRLASGRPGPVHLEVPRDVMGFDCEPLPPAVTKDRAPTPDATLIVEAARRLASARAPVILAGGGAKQADGALRALAERLDAPVVLTINARGLLHKHPLVVPASPSLQSVRDLIAGADVVLALGTELGATDYDLNATGAMPPPPGLIRVDICPDQLGRHKADIVMCGDAGVHINALLAALPHIEGTDGTRRAARTRDAARAEIGPEMRARLALLETIRDVCPGSLIVGDSAQLVYAGNLYYDHDRPGGWFNASVGFGALGYGIPAAIGAALAGSDAPVICLTGDGGAQFTLPELMVAVDERLPITFIIWNNSGYREIAESMQAVGVEVIGCDPTPPDFGMIAAACRMAFTRITDTPDAVSAAMRTPMPASGPRMIEIVVP